MKNLVRTLGFVAVTIVASILIVAAATKVVASGAPRNLFGNTLSGAWLQILGIPYELALGGWLILGQRKRAPLLVGIVTFLVFSTITIRDVLVGTARCGCFGDLPATPGIALAVDATALSLLFFAYVSLR